MVYYLYEPTSLVHFYSTQPEEIVSTITWLRNNGHRVQLPKKQKIESVSEMRIPFNKSGKSPFCPFVIQPLPDVQILVNIDSYRDLRTEARNAPCIGALYPLRSSIYTASYVPKLVLEALETFDWEKCENNAIRLMLQHNNRLMGLMDLETRINPDSN